MACVASRMARVASPGGQTLCTVHAGLILMVGNAIGNGGVGHQAGVVLHACTESALLRRQDWQRAVMCQEQHSVCAWADDVVALVCCNIYVGDGGMPFGSIRVSVRAVAATVGV